MVRKRIDSPLVSPRAAPVSIRTASAVDVDFVRELSGAVFSQFGEYDTFLPMYLDHPSVYAVIAELAGVPAGFMMLGLVTSRRHLPPEQQHLHCAQPAAEWEPGCAPARAGPGRDRSTEWLDAELLAIAVSPEHQSRRVGSRLLEVAVDCAEGWRRTSGVRSLQLNVAATNLRAARLFERMGFRVLDPHDGDYPRGQRSVRMVRSLLSEPIDPPRSPAD